MIPARALLGAFIVFIAAAPFILPSSSRAAELHRARDMVSSVVVLLTGVAGVMSFGSRCSPASRRTHGG